LFSVQWELTHRCNQSCAHCYLDVKAPGSVPRPDEPAELDTSECLHAIDEMVALGALNLTLTGGELLVREDWAVIASHARRKHTALRLFTNGSLIDERVADQIARLHPTGVEISVYGADAETHESITRVRGSFCRATGALRLLRERGVHTVMKTPVMLQNVGQYHAMQALAAELGARFRHDASITPSANPRLDLRQFRMTDDDLRTYYRATMNPAHPAVHTMAPDQSPCGIGKAALTLDPYGNVFPCVEVRTAAGNLRRSSLREIWEGAALWGELRCLTWAELPACSDCKLANYCGRCHGLALQVDGDLRAASTENCRQARIRIAIDEERTQLGANDNAGQQDFSTTG
jgi:radical SAM protein with 4Fe4S-binding SPASM domain